MKTKVSESIERQTAIYCHLLLANQALKNNQLVLSNLQKLTKCS